jgi:hypothetical protein
MVDFTVKTTGGIDALDVVCRALDVLRDKFVKHTFVTSSSSSEHNQLLSGLLPPPPTSS